MASIHIYTFSIGETIYTIYTYINIGVNRGDYLWYLYIYKHNRGDYLYIVI